MIFGQGGGGCRFNRRLSAGPAVLRCGRGNGTDLAIVSGVFVQILDLQLAASYGYLIPHHTLVTDRLKSQDETIRLASHGFSTRNAQH